MQANRDASTQVSSHASRQVSPLSHRVTSPIPYTPKGSTFSIRPLLYGIPLGAAGVLGALYRDQIIRGVKDIANYGKHMTINALRAALDTPFRSNVTSVSPNSTQTNASKTQTPIPLPSPDSRHPRTS